MSRENNAATRKNNEAVDLLSDPDYNLWVLVQHARDSMAAARTKELDEYGISIVEAAVLFVIQVAEQSGDIQATPAEISRWVFRKSNTIAALLNRMEKKGLVKRVNDLHKRNLVRIAITDTGQTVFKKSAKRKSLRKMMSVLSEEQRQQLWASLSLLRDSALKQLGAKQKPPFPQL